MDEAKYCITFFLQKTFWVVQFFHDQKFMINEADWFRSN